MRTRVLLVAAAATLAGCSRRAPFAAPAFDDAPAVEAAATADLPARVPAYGIVLKSGEIEVNIEAEDARLVHPGQAADVAAGPDKAAVACRVSRVLAGASAETGQALAWLAPSRAGALAANDFVSAGITVSIKRRVLVVPKSAVMIRDGKTLVVREETASPGKTAYVPVPVQTGDESDSAVEIKSGLKYGDRVVARGALGYVYPDFKAAAGD